MAWFRSGFQLLPQMQHSVWRLGTLPGSVLPCQQLIGRMRHSMGWFGTLLATCGCVGSSSLKCSNICCSWGCSIRLHAAVQLLYLMLLLGLSIRFRDAIFAATRSDATFYMAIWLSISITILLCQRHSLGCVVLCLAAWGFMLECMLLCLPLLAQTSIPLCSPRCCIPCDVLGFLSGFVPWCQRLLPQRHLPVLFGLGFLPTGHSLRHSSRSFSWGFLSYRVLPFAATPLFELRLFYQAAAVYAATRSSTTFYVAATHSIRLCAEILLAQTRIPLCSLRCCILFSSWGFLSRFVLR
jgi:hypothetical protein